MNSTKTVRKSSLIENMQTQIDLGFIIYLERSLVINSNSLKKRETKFYKFFVVANLYSMKMLHIWILGKNI